MAKGDKQPRRGSQVRARSAPEPTPAKPGRRHTKPLALLYREGRSAVCAALIHPTREGMKIESARGIYSALGLFMDEGYTFGSVREDVPEWAMARLPQGCQALGCANITGFPLPT